MKKIRKIEWPDSWKRTAKAATELLYPSTCPVCGKISQGVCEDCRKELKFVEQPVCYRCGKPVGSMEQEFCPDCQKTHHSYRQGCAMLLYEGKVKEAIHKIKYSNKREYLETFARMLARYGEKNVQMWRPEVLVPIPMYPKKKKFRGYNQAEILAGYLGEYWNLPVDTELLKKVRDTGAQKELDRATRRKNLLEAFEAERESPYQRVLLVDDVYTTGSTVDAAAESLKRAGISDIFYIAICIGHGDMIY